MLNKLRTFIMPLAMLIGIVFHQQVISFSFILPYSIFAMLFFTYLGIDKKRLKIKKIHFIVLLTQLSLTLAVYSLVKCLNPQLSNSLLIILIMPVASASAVITNMLGGSLESMTTYTIFNNIVISFFAPLFFAYANHATLSEFISSVATITLRVTPLILAPFIIALVISFLFPRIHATAKRYKNISFYIWVLALIVAMGMTVNRLLHSPNSFSSLVLIILCTVFTCLVLFIVGKWIGGKYGEPVVGGQGLGQKNTLLGIWMALSFFASPIVAIAPGIYIIVQNIINSYQIWKSQKNK